MLYLWAVVRTIFILFGVAVAALVVVTVASVSVWAFSYSFVAGFIALAGIAGVLSLFGHQLASVAKTSSAKRIGTYTHICCGAGAVFGLVLSLATYGYVTVQQSHEGAKPWEAHAARSKIPAPPPGFVLDAPQPQQPQRVPTVVTDPDLIAKLNASVATTTDAASIKAHCDALASNFGKLAEYYAALAKCYAAYPSVEKWPGTPVN